MQTAPLKKSFEIRNINKRYKFSKWCKHHSNSNEAQVKNKTGHVIAAKTVRAVWVTVWDVRKRATEGNRDEVTELHLESKKVKISK